MARSFRAAFAAVEGARFDAVVGYSIAPHEHAPIDPGVETAFREFDQRHFRGVVRWLCSLRRHYDQSDAEEAVQDTLAFLIEKRADALRGGPESWLGLLRSLSRYRLLDLAARPGRVDSIERLAGLAGDAPFAGASPCVAPTADADEDSRYVLPPREGEAWTRTQIIGALQRFLDYHGHRPRTADCRAVHCLPSLATIYRHFDSFADALIAAGIVPDAPRRRRRRWGPVEAAKVCLSFRRRNGRWPDGSDARRNPGDLPGAEVMRRYFGGTRAGEVQQGAETILS